MACNGFTLLGLSPLLLALFGAIPLCGGLGIACCMFFEAAGAPHSDRGAAEANSLLIFYGASRSSCENLISLVIHGRRAQLAMDTLVLWGASIILIDCDLGIGAGATVGGMLSLPSASSASRSGSDTAARRGVADRHRRRSRINIVCSTWASPWPAWPRR